MQKLLDINFLFYSSQNRKCLQLRFIIANMLMCKVIEFQVDIARFDFNLPIVANWKCLYLNVIYISLVLPSYFVKNHLVIKQYTPTIVMTILEKERLPQQILGLKQTLWSTLVYFSCHLSRWPDKANFKQTANCWFLCEYEVACSLKATKLRRFFTTYLLQHITQRCS